MDCNKKKKNRFGIFGDVRVEDSQWKRNHSLCIQKLRIGMVN